MNLRSSLRLASPFALTLTLAFVAPAALTEAGLGALPGAESVSLAQGAPPANDAVTEIARQRYQEGVKDFLDKVPTAEFVELSDAGHTAAGDDNDAFSEVVVQFVNR